MAVECSSIRNRHQANTFQHFATQICMTIFCAIVLDMCTVVLPPCPGPFSCPFEFHEKSQTFMLDWSGINTAISAALRSALFIILLYCGNSIQRNLVICKKAVKQVHRLRTRVQLMLKLHSCALPKTINRWQFMHGFAGLVTTKLQLSQVTGSRVMSPLPGTIAGYRESPQLECQPPSPPPCGKRSSPSV